MWKIMFYLLIETNLVINSHIPVGKGVRPEHARLYVLVLVHIQVLVEGDLRPPTLLDELRLGPHVEEVEIRTVAAIEKSGQKSRVHMRI